ncbi:pleckstrin homology domain-containing family G member 5-like isoform X1 [Latimeria chalumnae]|uniref:pleckstrin homology domain-containing family G member 5-like isoform X1 n=1 Tax=Latimeria chalumnae TaxID=7897 RepID=UPI00313D390D
MISARPWNSDRFTMTKPIITRVTYSPEQEGPADRILQHPRPARTQLFSNGRVASRIELYENGGHILSPGDGPPSWIPTLSHTDRKGIAGTVGYQCGGKHRKKHHNVHTLTSGTSPDSLHRQGNNEGSWTIRGHTNIHDTIFTQSSSSKDSFQVERLKEALYSYSMFGLRQPQNHQKVREGEETRINLERSWKEIVEGYQKMTKKESHQQEAIWELLCTELSYMESLRVINDLFICGLLNLQEIGLLTQVKAELLFGNIQQLILTHQTIWKEVMSPAIQEARQTRKPFDPLHFAEGFRTFPEQFKPYIQYCLDEETCMKFARDQLKENELFNIYVRWAENHKQCGRLRLSDMLVKPHQRITKYPLLFKAILKRTDDPYTQEALINNITSMENFLRHINFQMQLKEEHQKLIITAKRIGGYEVVESSTDEVEKNVKKFCMLDLTSPIIGVGPENIRQLLLEGAMKMKDGKDSKMEVHCFLFTDVFLITKTGKKSEKGKVIRQPFMVEKMICQELKDPGSFLIIYLNEFHCAVSAFTLQAPNSRICKEWMNTILNAKVGNASLYRWAQR